MKVGFHVDQMWFSAPGGIGTYVRELLAALPSADPTLELTPFHARWGRPARSSAALGPSVVEVPGSIRTLYPRWALTGRPPLPAALGGCDVLHATNHAAVPPAARRQALVVTVHDLAFDAFPQTFPRDWRWLYRRGVHAAARRADVVLAPSRATADDLEDRYGVDPGRIRVTPLASSLPATTTDVDEVLGRLGLARPYVLCPATLEARKNQARLVRAYRQVAPEVPHSLVLAGPAGWRSGELDAELERGGGGSVRLTGFLQGAELDAVLRGADLVAYPSLYEGFGLPIVEAMCRGVPVVTSTTPACAETAGDAALLVDPEDVGGIADALARVLTDRELHVSLAAKGRARAAGFSWERTARATLDAYRDAIAATRS